MSREVNRDILWAPWRMAYVGGDKTKPQEKKALPILPGGDADCFICQAVVDDPAEDENRLVIGRTATTITLLNRFPYNNGHLLVAPKRHVAALDLTTSEEWRDISTELTFWVGAIRREMNADGFNVGLNLGRVAGAGLPGHLHWHIVPRWNGDANFLTTVGSAKAIPQALEELWNLLKRD